MSTNGAPNYDIVRSDNCEMKLELNIKVSGLRNADFVTQSDPFAVVYVNDMSTAPVLPKKTVMPLRHPLNVGPALKRIRNKPKLAQRTAPWEHAGTTETVQNKLEASFATPVKVSYFFERAQTVVIDVYDSDSNSRNLLAHDYLGSAMFSLSSLVRAKGQYLNLPLGIQEHPDLACGNVTIVAEDKARRRYQLRMDVILTYFKRPCVLGSFDGPFLIISRRAGHAEAPWMPMFKSKAAGRRDRSHNASRYSFTFDSIRESFERLADGREDTQLRFEVEFIFFYKKKITAAVEMSFAEWHSRDDTVELFKPGVDGRGEGSRSLGTLTLRNYRIMREPQFVDYIMGGCEISLVIGIDFTASNGDSLQPNSLHFCDSYNSNQYELAIRAVGDILADYDSDNCFPTYGFGARLAPNYDRVSHCFALTGHDDPTCHGVDGVLNAYRQTLNYAHLSGPTEFSALIHTAARHAEAESMKYEQAYTILLIVTDGVINDFEETTHAIVEASRLPLSIVIIGVGTANFDAMDMLDGDDIPLSTQRCRDIVQFVPFSRFQNRPDILASKVLEEIPNQVVEYFTMKRIMPNPPTEGHPNAQSPYYGDTFGPDELHQTASQQTAPHQPEPQAGSHDEVPHQPGLQDEVPHQPGPQDEVPHQPGPQDEVPHQPGLQDEALHQPASHNVAPHQSAPHNGTTLQAPPHDANLHQAPSHLAAPHHALSHHAPSHESAPHQASPHDRAQYRAAPYQALPHGAASRQAPPHGAAHHQASSHDAAQYQAAPYQRSVQYAQPQFDPNTPSHSQAMPSHFSPNHQRTLHSNSGRYLPAGSRTSYHGTHQQGMPYTSPNAMMYGNMTASNPNAVPSYQAGNMVNGVYERAGGSANGMYAPGPNDTSSVPHDERSSSEEMHRASQQHYARPNAANQYQPLNPVGPPHPREGQYAHLSVSYGQRPQQHPKSFTNSMPQQTTASQ